MAYILLVEDDPRIREDVPVFFREGGHFVRVAGDLETALRDARSLQAGDVVLTDKNLGGHRGIHPLLDYLKDEKPEVKVILSSGEPSTFARRELYAHAFHEKGTSYLPLLALIEQWTQQVP